MREVVVFGDQNSLDFSEVRWNVLRIPEVSLRIERAQKVWDSECRSCFSFQHFLSSEDTTFYGNINLKSLSLAIVQLGLLDRYESRFRRPQYVVGNTQNDSALQVVAGKMSFEEMIAQSQACGALRPLSPLHLASDTILNGRALPSFQAVKRLDEKIEFVGEADMGLPKVLQVLADTEGVQKIIHVGPGSMEKSRMPDTLEARDIQVVESIDADPMLGWFWVAQRKRELARA